MNSNKTENPETSAESLARLRAGKLTGAVRFQASADLETVPPELFELAGSLEYLDLSKNRLRTLPAEMASLRKLRILFLSHNQFTEFPEVLSHCSNLSMVGIKSNKLEVVSETCLPAKLRWLTLTDNRIARIPRAIGKLDRLQKLLLSGNQLTELPSELARCGNIELLRISVNNLRDLPSWITGLPRLSWLAMAGNPCTPLRLTGSTVPAIPYTALELGEMLNESPSSRVYRAHWKERSDNVRPVAVKIYKGALTSDGHPRDEMRALLEAGNHPNLLVVLGKVTDAPEGREGLVFDLIPQSFDKLGYPPDFDTCSRDTFKAGARFTPEFILRAAKSVAAATLHLHSKALTHGDLYAHNILSDSTGQSILADFGAAASFGGLSVAEANGIKRLESRAFGCLLDDLLARISDGGELSPLYGPLCAMRDQCMHELTEKRPDFEMLAQVLAGF